jgi:leader peptidase (prepilin peptidase)/N-methyltransferase
LETFEAAYLFVGTFFALAYGLLIGSFLNVCIFRLPPKIYFFDDLFFQGGAGGIASDVKELWKSVFGGKKAGNASDGKLKVEPFLYAETVWPLHIYPESAAITAITHNYNLFKEFFPDPVTIVKPRSFCPSCRRTILWWMNIPLLSYIFLGARCYYCKAEISPRYPINELVSGLLCAGLFYVYGVNNFSTFIYYYILAAICIVVFFIDLDHWLILDEITLPFSLAGVAGSLLIPAGFFKTTPDIFESLLFSDNPPPLYQWFAGLKAHVPAWIHPESLLQSMLGAVLSFGAFYCIAVLGTLMAGREAMGGGDIKFAMLMGAFLGPQKAFLAFFLSVLLGTAIMAPGMLLGRKTGKDQVPFGCFLTISTVITIFLGDMIVERYLNWPGMFQIPFPEGQ